MAKTKKNMRGGANVPKKIINNGSSFRSKSFSSGTGTGSGTLPRTLRRPPANSTLGIPGDNTTLRRNPGNNNIIKTDTGTGTGTLRRNNNNVITEYMSKLQSVDSSTDQPKPQQSSQSTVSAKDAVQMQLSSHTEPKTNVKSSTSVSNQAQKFITNLQKTATLERATGTDGSTQNQGPNLTLIRKSKPQTLVNQVLKEKKAKSNQEEKYVKNIFQQSYSNPGSINIVGTKLLAFGSEEYAEGGKDYLKRILRSNHADTVDKYLQSQIAEAKINKEDIPQFVEGKIEEIKNKMIADNPNLLSDTAKIASSLVEKRLQALGPSLSDESKKIILDSSTPINERMEKVKEVTRGMNIGPNELNFFKRALLSSEIGTKNQNASVNNKVNAQFTKKSGQENSNLPNLTKKNATSATSTTAGTSTSAEPLSDKEIERIKSTAQTERFFESDRYKELGFINQYVAKKRLVWSDIFGRKSSLVNLEGLEPTKAEDLFTKDPIEKAEKKSEKLAKSKKLELDEKINEILRKTPIYESVNDKEIIYQSTLHGWEPQAYMEKLNAHTLAKREKYLEGLKPTFNSEGIPMDVSQTSTRDLRQMRSAYQDKIQAAENEKQRLAEELLKPSPGTKFYGPPDVVLKQVENTALEALKNKKYKPIVGTNFKFLALASTTSLPALAEFILDKTPISTNPNSEYIRKEAIKRGIPPVDLLERLNERSMAKRQKYFTEIMRQFKESPGSIADENINLYAQFNLDQNISTENISKLIEEGNSSTMVSQRRRLNTPLFRLGY
jgi:hypothetical protein